MDWRLSQLLPPCANSKALCSFGSAIPPRETCHAISSIVEIDVLLNDADEEEEEN